MPPLILARIVLPLPLKLYSLAKLPPKEGFTYFGFLYVIKLIYPANICPCLTLYGPRTTSICLISFGAILVVIGSILFGHELEPLIPLLITVLTCSYLNEFIVGSNEKALRFVIEMPGIFSIKSPVDLDKP